MKSERLSHSYHQGAGQWILEMRQNSSPLSEPFNQCHLPFPYSTPNSAAVLNSCLEKGYQVYATIPKGIVGIDSLHLFDRNLYCSST